jgi:hypothetical protein
MRTIMLPTDKFDLTKENADAAMNDTQKEQCKGCEFWHSTDSLEGICRRLPPTVLPYLYEEHGEVVTDIITRYPTTDYNEWCGEWKPGSRRKDA